MSLQEIVILNREPTNNEGYIGGGCKLAKTVEWPKDANGKPCMHLATVPCGLFDKHSDNRVVSIFIPYADDRYYKQIRGDLSENFTTVIIHDNSGVIRNCFSDASIISSPKAIRVEKRDQEDTVDICGSKIFNVPGWLQGEELYEDHHCMFSFYGNDFSSAFEENRGLFSDGVVYIFIHDDYKKFKNGELVGKLIWQL